MVPTRTDPWRRILLSVLNQPYLELFINALFYNTVEFAAKTAHSTFQSSSTQHLQDSKALMQQFLNFYPILPRPPIHVTVGIAPRSVYHLDLPKSRRAVLAEERLERQQIEVTLARLAIEAEQQRNERLMLQVLRRLIRLIINPAVNTLQCKS